MFATLHRKSLSMSLGVLLAGASACTWAASTTAAVDAGAAPANQTAQVTLILKLHNQAALEDYIRQTVTPGSAHYQQFLSTSQFAQQYGATNADIARVQSYLRAQGLSGEVLPSHLAVRISGTVGQFNQLFQTSVHNYVSHENGRGFHKPAIHPQVPSAISDVVDVISGLSNENLYRAHHVSAPAFAALGAANAKTNALSAKGSSGASSNPTASGIPGEYTVGDVANFYDINPLYKRGVVGKGSTVAIVTLSNFYPSDATTYWSDIGLATKPNRITQVHVDGGGAIDGGSGETSIDVEQSGGIAPYANIMVYDAPNTQSGYVDAFAQAVSDNVADSISTSWGGPEIFDFAALNVNGASDTDTTDAGDLRAFHAIFLEAAVQGQSLFAAAGDSGAYDTVRELGTGTGAGDFTAPLTVDAPASDPYITAAGGTTTPYSYAFGNGPVASITQESVWGWDYIQNYFDTYVQPINLFSSGGGGGGVSVYWHTPFYQLFTNGIRRSEPNQSLVYNDPSAGPTTLLKLPSHFAGRNVPDISLNADPETGYLYVSTVDGGLNSGEGGTSFVAPQLNGISALLRQSTGHRIGLWNPQVYALQNIFGYGSFSAFRSIRAGDNWFYHGAPHYNPGAGIGALDVANLDVFLRSGF
ncbi:peptidase S53 [Dyella monticola]|uniref:Peptidase S53 n=1 Tax=Dyella monticola TaxID=1927958 RepID=A0A370X850_9GAMM|nr:S53 family peptidase [Dyella monticola]RDS84604.1 peptidase S53 [Dyella monticola]